MEQLIIQIARKNKTWGSRRIKGQLKYLGHNVCHTTIDNVLKRNGYPCRPDRARQTRWSKFLRTHWESLAAIDFFSTEIYTMTLEFSGGMATYLHIGRPAPLPSKGPMENVRETNRMRMVSFAHVRRWIVEALLTCAVLAAGFVALVWFTTFHPTSREQVAVTCSDGTPTLSSGQAVKILTWNIQFMAGKNHVFFFDVFDGNGPDERPSAQDMELTLEEVARVIRAEAPDIVLLQEVDDGARRTDYQDQLASLLHRLGQEYPCYCSAFYRKAKYVSHARIRGAVGMKLAVLSKYQIRQATRVPRSKARSFYQGNCMWRGGVVDVNDPVNDALPFHPPSPETPSGSGNSP